MHNGNDVADGILGVLTMLEQPTVNWSGIRLILNAIQQFDTMAAYASMTPKIGSIEQLAAFASDLKKASIVASRTDSPVAELKIIMQQIANAWVDSSRFTLAA